MTNEILSHPAARVAGSSGVVSKLPKMVLKLYKFDMSPPARAAMMTCELLGVPVEYVDVNLQAGEHMTPEYLKKNPLHTVPVFEDGDFAIGDSHAIITYLADAYGKQDSFYPKDLKNRAFVNRMLYFNNSVLFHKLVDIVLPFWIEGDTSVPVKRLEDVEQAYGFLEEFLTRTKFVAGTNLTVADVAIYATVSSLDLIKKLDATKFPKSVVWMKHIEQQPYAKKQNAPGLQIYKTALGSLIANIPK